MSFAPEEHKLNEVDNYAEDRVTGDIPPARYRGATSDPAFGYLLALALSIGLTPLIGSGNADLRYTVAWLALAMVGVLAWLLGHGERIGQEKPENLTWGVVFGLIVGAPFFVFGGEVLKPAIDQMFQGLTPGTVLAYLIFVMPLGETLFFRGLLQQNRAFWIVGLLSSLWSVILFFPLMDLGGYPAVAAIIAIILLIMNIIYSYVRERNGLAAAWVCQIVMNLLMVFLPFL